MARRASRTSGGGGEPIGGSGGRIRPVGVDETRLRVRDPQQLHPAVRRGAEVAFMKREGSGLGLPALDRDERSSEMGISGSGVVEQLQFACQLESLVDEFGGAHQSSPPRFCQGEAAEHVHAVGAVRTTWGLERPLQPLDARLGIAQVEVRAPDGCHGEGREHREIGHVDAGRG